MLPDALFTAPELSVALVGRLLGLGGLLPFIACVAGLWVREDMLFLQAMLLYGAVILSFLGGIQWGLALGSSAAAGQLLWSVVPSLVAWGALFTGPLAGPLILAAGFVAAWAWEQRAPQARRVPAWYRSLRHQLTIVVVLCMIAGAIWSSRLL
jgi:hypothetical protein